MKKEFIAFLGSEFTIEWYYDQRGKSQALDYFEELSFDRQEKVMHLFEIMGNTGKIKNKEKFRSEEDKIYAFKPQPDRFLCFFFKGSKIIVTNAFEKKKDKLPATEKERALRYKDDYEYQVKRGAYYDEEDD